jgi:hypothetical protein
VLLGLREPDVLALPPCKFVQVPTQLPQPVEDAPGDGSLRAGAVALKLLDDKGRDQQLQLALVHEHPQRHNPLLPIASRR